MILSKKSLKKVYNGILDFVFPRHCVSCGKINPEGEFEHICPECAKSIMQLNIPRCTLCSAPIGIFNMPNIHGCPQCADRNLAFKKSLCLCAFNGAARDLTLELKYKTGAYAIYDMAKIAKKNDELKNYIRDAILVPVPLHRARLIKRKYNQSQLIATMLTLAFPESNAKIIPILKRVRNTQTQTTFDKLKRAENIKDAFAVRKTKQISEFTKDTNIILVDDVMTSGATLSECAKVLKKSGLKNVSVFTFAKRL